MANKYTDRELLDFNFQQSENATLAEQQKVAAEQALSNLGGYNFNYGRQDDYSKAMDAILNRKQFSYDLNGDALYQQYKDNYINQGKMAMMDTMGQASAMTGGYGNSYAATVGNQAYQSSLQNLNNVIPQLYQLALESYSAEGDRLNNNLNVLGTDRQLEESSYSNKYNSDLARLSADRSYYDSNYNNIYNREYTTYSDMVNSNNTNYWNEYNAGYQAARDAVADEQWLKQYMLSADLSSYQNQIASLSSQISGMIDPDKLEVDPETGAWLKYDGKTITGNSGSSSKTNITPVVSEFRTKKGDNFTVTIGDKSYKVENEGKVDSEKTLASIKAGTRYGDITIAKNGNAYILSGNNYYRIGNLNGFLNIGISSKSGYDDLLLALGK